MVNHLLRLGFLARFFFFSPWAARLLLLMGLFGAVAFVIGKAIDCGSWEPLFVVGGVTLVVGAITIYVAVVLFMFPAQLMSFVSSRQYGLLPYVRHYLAALIVCVLLILQIVAYCILMLGFKSDHAIHYSLVFAIMLIIGFVVILSFVSLGSFQFLFFFIVPAINFYLIPHLNVMHDLVLSTILVCLWAVFLGWWFSWHPKKYYKNLIAMNPGELNKQYVSAGGAFFSRGAVPQNLESGILFGLFGHTFYQVKMFLAALLFMGSIFALLFILFPRDLGKSLMTGVTIGVAIQIIQIGYNYSLALFKNINKFWLYYSLERTQLFNTIERKVAVLYLQNFIIITLIILTLSFFISIDYLHPKNVALFALASLLITPFTLYMVFIVYGKWRGSIKVFHWANGVAMMVLLGMCFLGIEFFAYNEIGKYVSHLLAIVLAFTGLLLVMRQYAKRLWQQVDLVRVAS